MTTETRPLPDAAGGRLDDTPIVQHPYIPLTDDDRAAMLEAIGVGSTAELFADIPAEHFRPPLGIPDALSELELLDDMRSLAARRTALRRTTRSSSGRARTGISGLRSSTRS